MTGVGDRPKTFNEYVRITDKRITSLERDLYRSGAISLEKNILAGPGIDITGTGTNADPMIISAEAVATTPLPAPVRYIPGSTHNVTATAFGTQVAGTVTQSMTTTKQLWVLVTLGVWLVASAGETRGGIALGGATVVAPPNFQQGGVVGSGAWGQTLYVAATDAPASAQRTSQRLYLLEPGTTTFTMEAYLITAGTHSWNYPTLEIIPIAYSDDGSTTMLDDTGWVNVAVSGGFTADTIPPLARRIDNVVYLRGGWTSAGLTAGSSFNVGVVPAGLRPVSNHIARAGSSGGTTSAGLVVLTDGTVSVRLNATLGTYYHMNSVYLID